jgi:sugar phosphate permease
MTKRIHPAWTALVVTFLTLMATAGFRSAPSVIIVPLEEAFGWSRSQVSFAVAINVLLYGLIAPFAAALMERFTVRKVVIIALTFVAISAASTVFISQPWHLWLLWGVCVGVGTGSMALVFAATIANRWFIKHKGLVVGALTAASATGQLIFLPTLSHFAVTYGWKSVSITIAVASLAVVPLIYLFLKESPESIGITPYGAPDDWQPIAKSELSAFRLAIDTISKAKSNRDFKILFFTFFVCGLSTNGLIGTHFIPAAHDHGMAQPVAASLLALIGVFDVVGTLCSGYLTDRFDPRKLLFFYYGLRGLSLFLLPSILFSSVHPSTLVFVIFYGLDWVATVPPTLVLSRIVLGPGRGTIVYGWVFVAHQIGASVAALGAAILRVQFGDYAVSFYIAAAMCLVAAYLVLQIAKGKVTSELRI